jgi:iron-sulfur cluster repair protein YtfE (RIC family)
MSEILKLRQEHARLMEIAGRLTKIVAGLHPPEAGDLFKLRHELSSTLIGHLKSEDWVLYPRLLASGQGKIAETARAFSDEMGGLAKAYTAYADKWTATSIDKDWAGYCGETRGIIDALTKRITRENRELYPLLEALDKAA